MSVETIRTEAEEFWHGRCLDCAHPEHPMTCHEMVPNGDPSNGPAYCECHASCAGMEQALTRLAARVKALPAHDKRSVPGGRMVFVRDVLALLGDR